MSEDHVLIPRALLEDLRDHAADYMASNSWWKDEPRARHQEQYEKIGRDVENANKLLAAIDEVKE